MSEANETPHSASQASAPLTRTAGSSAARRGRERGAEALADALRDRVALEHVDAVEHVAGGRVHAQVRGHQVEGARPHGAVEAQDLAEHATDRRVALGDLHDRVDVFVRDRAPCTVT